MDTHDSSVPKLVTSLAKIRMNEEQLTKVFFEKYEVKKVRHKLYFMSVGT